MKPKVKEGESSAYETGDDVGELGANEVDEGVERLGAARELAAHAAEAGKAELKLDE